MSDNSNEDKRPVGERLRDIINPALADDRRSVIQAEILDAYFERAASSLPELIERNYAKIFNKVVDRKKSKGGEVVLLEPEERNEIVIRQITEVEKTMMGFQVKYSPNQRFEIEICVAFTTFTASDVKEMPGYIKLHEAARDADVAIKIVGLTADEARTPLGYTLPAMLIIDGSKSYEQGAMENSNMYPNLPPPKVPFDLHKSNEFDL